MPTTLDLATKIEYALNRDKPVLVRSGQSEAHAFVAAARALSGGKIEPWQVGMIPARTEAEASQLIALAGKAPVLISGLENAAPGVCKAVVQFLRTARQPIVVLAHGEIHKDILAECNVLD